MKANQMSLVLCEQHSRAYKLELKEIVVHEREDLEAILCRLGEVIGKPIKKPDIEI
ncbi:MAG: hypothetical protein O7D30_12785 [Rickettsia endosymbiont of Ixodes persulcatus]|nr:hypothetical protein [Rickettsia endosymbiont of Ixodes persulcatus]